MTMYKNTPLLFCWLSVSVGSIILGISSSPGVASAFTTSHVVPKNRASASTSSSCLFGTRMKFQTPSRVVSQTEYLQLEADGEDAWKTMDLVDILRQGGVGVLPTETGYGLVTPLSSKAGLERLERILQQQSQQPVALSLLCSNLQMIDEYCFGIDKTAFKILKKNLPGPYTFILPAKSTLPKAVVADVKGLSGPSKFATLGVAISTDPILRYLQDELLEGNMPLLFSPLTSITKEEEDDNEKDSDDNEPFETLVQWDFHDASWYNDVDFIVQAGPRPKDASTIFDLSVVRGEAVLVKEGLGALELAI